MITVQLDKKKHNREAFDCGADALNNYLHVIAGQQSSRDNTRTFVLEDANVSESIIGFYTLTMTSFNLNALPEKLQKKHNNVKAGGLIARLAVDKRYVKQGFGEWLLIDALKKLECYATQLEGDKIFSLRLIAHFCSKSRMCLYNSSSIVFSK